MTDPGVQPALSPAVRSVTLSSHDTLDNDPNSLAPVEEDEDDQELEDLAEEANRPPRRRHARAAEPSTGST